MAFNYLWELENSDGLRDQSEMENCLEYFSLEEIREARFLQAPYKDKPCKAHGSPWLCALDWSQPEYIVEKLNILSRLNVNVFQKIHHGLIPIDCLDASFDFEYDDFSLILAAYEIILKAMQQQSKERLPVPMQVIMHIHKRFLETVAKHTGKEWVNDSRISYFLHALHVALSTGADINQKRCSMPTYSSLYKKTGQVELCIKPSLLPRLIKTYSVNGVYHWTDPILYKDIGEFYELLFVHGNKPDRAWSKFLSQVVSFQIPELFKVAGMTLSLMDHEDWQYVQRKLNRLHHRIANSDPAYPAAEEFNVRKLELIQSYQGPKSLKDICRKVLYNNIQDRRMVIYVESLPLPTLLQQYLLFK